MNTTLKILLFFILPIFSILLYPPSTLSSGIAVIITAIIAFGLIGMELMRGKKWSLTFSIFLQGFNVIVRLMMLVSQVVPKDGPINISILITNLIAICLSLWLLMRLDRVDVRTTVVY